MVFTTGMAMFGIFLMMVRARGAVIAGKDVENFYAAGIGLPTFFDCMCYTKKGICGQIEQKDRDDERKNNSVF